MQIGRNQRAGLGAQQVGGAVVVAGRADTEENDLGLEREDVLAVSDGSESLARIAVEELVQPGLESDPANCARYTGSAAVISRAGFPNLCAKPVTSPQGLAALVTDVFQRWVVGAAATTAQDAAVLFENAKNPGDPRVRAILKHLPDSPLSR